MSTPNDPDGQRPPAGQTGGGDDRSGADRADGNGQGEWSRSASAAGRPGASVAERPEVDRQGPPQGDGQRPSSGTGPGGVPPWQRVGSQLPATGGPVQPNRTDQPAGATVRAPIAKLDAEGNVGNRGAAPTARGRNSMTGKLIDGPTRNIDRNDLPEDLPDLDAIHHPAVTAAASAPAPASQAFRPVESVAPGPRGPLRAAVQLRRIDPWSTFKISSVLAIALFLIWMIAIGVLYVILDGMGVWDQVNSSFGTLVSSDTTADTSFQITAGGVFGIAALVGAVYVVVFTALTTVGAFIYNMSADLVGGVEITLADRD